jgi:oligosaccharide amylase
MPKTIVLGNGKTLIGIDKNAELRDLYFPFVGLENHVGGHFKHRVGVWVDGKNSWTNDGQWVISQKSGEETMSGESKAVNENLGIELDFEDVLYNEKNIFIRKVVVHNLWESPRQIKLYFNHEFEIYESHRGDTAYYDPKQNIIIHYKGRRVFLINALVDERSFDDYSVGIFGIEGKEGSYKDAEDGILSKNPIEHGKVDSIIGLTLDIEANTTKTVYYWISIAKTIQDVVDLNAYVLDRTPAYLMKTTKDFWHAWVNNRAFNFYHLEQDVVELFKKSLLILRSHVDDNGSILASGDSSLLQYGRDAYSYMWPRDGALSTVALDKAGDYNVAKRFFEFCNEVITKEGYFMHKYRPDKSLGSSWHPWLYQQKPQLPIQEDETALVLYSLWKHYEFSKDLEFIESIYNSLIKKSADFMLSYVFDESGLPHPSYDLWEEKFGISTFTASSVYAAFIAAANFSRLLGKAENEKKYSNAATKLKDAIIKYLYNDEKKMFYKSINIKGDVIEYDATLDMSSIYGIFRFRVLDALDPRVVASIKTMEELASKIPIGGMMRYENDMYHKVSSDVPGNPWIITTLWLAQYYIVSAKEEKDFDKVKEILKWVVKRASTTGVLPEQLDPNTGNHLSATPLTWSHSEFVSTIINYLEKLEELGILHQEEIKRGIE